MRLALGTAQFGMNYGIANMSGQVIYGEIKNILQRANIVGIDTLDTAVAYGNSENILGKLDMQHWKLITKLPEVPNLCHNVRDWVEKQVNQSMNRLGTSQLYGVLLHKPSQLLEHVGPDLYDALQIAKSKGLTRKIGVSIYDCSELNRFLDTYDLDLVQAPLNILDRSLEESGWIKRLNYKNIEIHTRSVFLQGLLLLPANRRPKKFDRWIGVWRTWDAWLDQERLTPLQACMRYVYNLPQIDRVVVGVDTADQLHQLIEAAKGELRTLPDFKSLRDARLINPAQWSQL